MLGKDVIERLSRLRRAQIAATPPTAARHAVSESPEPVVMAGHESQTHWGPCWRIDTPLEPLLPVLRDELRLVDSRMPELAARTDVHRDLAALAAAFPSQILLLDLETCGFAGSLVFLAGLVHADSQGLRLTQLLARNYAEEKAVLQSLWQATTGKQVLITFNGKSFDWPSVHDRSTLHHLGRDDRDRTAQPRLSVVAPPIPDAMTRFDARPDLQHVDLLHHCRRFWGRKLPNCRLQTLEQYLCRRRRVADIPGREIPAAYDDYVRTGDARWMKVILHHNALDLVTLLQLSLRLCFYTCDAPPASSNSEPAKRLRVTRSAG
jgi:uncharacterized protein YprB with RNaseH-like and TPR domain